MKISFIVVLYNTSEQEILRLKKEIRNLGGKQGSIFLIDNSKNRQGYAFGVNKGMKKVMQENADVIVILNPDVSIKNLTAQKISDAAEHFDIWGYAMKQGERIYYGGEIDKWRMSGGLITRKPKMRFVPVDFVSGSLMYIKTEVVEQIGLFNKKYFMYYEDVEYCERARRAGFRIGIDSRFVYEHYERSKENRAKSWYLWRNRLWFLLEYGSVKQKLYELMRLPKTFVELFIR